ncbi:MAG: amino acid ABC transporter permease [Deltaproteobacteria bacterium]|nr:amino acid ABC transporter permease [Deltaproteobacteria bacterium]
MALYVRKQLLEPRQPPVERDSASIRIFKRAFSSVPNGILTCIVIGFFVTVGIWFIKWGVLTAQWFGDSAAACPDPDGACWPYIIARWKPILAGQYPYKELWRVYAFMAMLIGLIAWITIDRIPSKGIAITVSLTLFPAFSAVILLGGVFGLSTVATNEWGGVLITVVTAVFTMIFSLPLGLILAVGRMSNMPIIKTFCIAFVELMRGTPLLTVLFVAATIFPLVLPEGVHIDLFARALIAFLLFNGAMISEVFRGGLQSIRRGQYEAATTIGLGWLATFVFIILPQAVRVIIPALVNSMVAIIKETTVLLVIGLFDFMAIIHSGVASQDWIGGSHILVSGYVFTALCFMLVCSSLSKYSRRFERRAGS